MLSTEFLLTSCIVVLIPGTGVLYTLSVGLFKGRRASLFAAMGCTLGIIPSLLASTLGAAALFHTSALAFQMLKFAGVAYLLYLAWSMWHADVLADNNNVQASARGRDIALRGFLLNILNPKLSLFFLAFLPQFVPAQASEPLMHLLFLGLVFMAITLLIFIAYGLMANAFSQYVMSSEKVALAVQRTFAGSFAALGLKLAFTERS